MKTKIRKKIYDNLTGREIFSQEFQDKYYLHKQIKMALPEYSDEILFQTINICNEKIKSPSKKNRFVDVFTETLTKLTNPDGMYFHSRTDKDWP